VRAFLKKHLNILPPNRKMPCNCGKKRQASAPDEPSPLFIQEPPEWGPVLWNYLHLLVERLGTSGSKMVDTDQATYMEFLLQGLPSILPCTDCQQHAAEYMSVFPLPPLKGLYGDALRRTARQWLFDFHNNVRQRKEQPILFTQADECIAVYQGKHLSKADYQRFVQTVASAVRQGWIRMDPWRKWFSHSEKLRILSGVQSI